MAAIITEKFRQASADSFKTSFGTDKYYLFVGKSQPWTSEGAASDSLPPAPVDSVAPESYYWDDMIAAKLIGTTNTTFAIPRRDFPSSENTTAFDMYRHDVAGTTTSGNYPSKTTYYPLDQMICLSQTEIVKILNFYIPFNFTSKID